MTVSMKALCTLVRFHHNLQDCLTEFIWICYTVISVLLCTSLVVS